MLFGCSHFVYMEFIDNVNKTLKDDMMSTLRSGSKVAIAASCFSIYVFQELEEQLDNISELRFIFTSPSFDARQIVALERQINVTKQPRRKREFFLELQK